MAILQLFLKILKVKLSHGTSHRVGGGPD
jgi:hypothetical protein